MTSSCASDDTLELYALGTLPQPRADGVEEHLLLCERCRNRLSTIEEFVRVMRMGLRLSSPFVTFWQLHATADGPVEIWVERGDSGCWLSAREGPAHSGGSRFATESEALRDAVQSFREMFPEHVCSTKCLS